MKKGAKPLELSALVNRLLTFCPTADCDADAANIAQARWWMGGGWLGNPELGPGSGSGPAAGTLALA